MLVCFMDIINKILFKKRKKAKIFVMLAVILFVIALDVLLISLSGLDNISSKLFGESQKGMISTLNKKDSILSYLDNAALLSLRSSYQLELAENAGYFERVDSSSQDADVTGFGFHIYPMISNEQGNLANFDYEKEYLKLFKSKFLEFTSQDSYLYNKKFIDTSIKQGYIVGHAEMPEIRLLITTDIIKKYYFLPGSSINLIKQDTHTIGVVNNIINADMSMPYIANLGPGDCSAFISRMLDYAYSKSKTDIGSHSVECLPNNAWDVAACYLYKAKQNPDSSRVVYAGEGLKYDELISVEDLLKPGDLLFTTSIAWGKYTGYNEYSSLGDSVTYYCEKDSIPNPNSQYPQYCLYQDKPNGYSSDIEYENYPIVTHIFMYLGEQNGKRIIANLFNKKSVDESLQTFVNNPSTGGDGVRIIIRPKYKQVKSVLI